MKIFLLFVTLFFPAALAATQHKPVFLWKDIAGMEKERTKLYIYKAPDTLNTGVSVIICPGGSYHHLGMENEGRQVAKWLNCQGISAFVLAYRVGWGGYRHPAMIEDLQRAVQFVRENTATLHIDANKVGAMGFSAGGHLVTMAGVFHNNNFLSSIGVKTNVSLCPDFIVAVYPVVSMQDSIVHTWSRSNLLGYNATKDMKDKFSMELQIPDNMPPVFLVATKDDAVVKYQNSVELNKALIQKNIRHKFLLFDVGGHGFGIGSKKSSNTNRWKFTLKEWLIENKFIKEL